jgi:hypothetical protein
MLQPPTELLQPAGLRATADLRRPCGHVLLPAADMLQPAAVLRATGLRTCAVGVSARTGRRTAIDCRVAAAN